MSYRDFIKVLLTQLLAGLAVDLIARAFHLTGC